MNSVKFLDEHITTSNGCCKYTAYFNYDSMPKINGILCNSIWAPHDFINSLDECNTPMFYDRWHYTPNYHGNPTQENVLHPEIAKFFGWQIINGKKRFVRHISFRIDSSGHANPDNIASIYVKDTIISVYNINGRSYEGDHSIHYSDPYFVKLCETLLTKKFELVHYNFPNPGIEDISKHRTLHESCVLQKNSCAIRYIDGIIYPDAQLTTWRSNFPYISNSKENKDNIRIWDESAGAHKYLTKITAEKYPDFFGNVVYVDFSKDSCCPSGDGHCKIRQRYTDSERKNLVFITTEIDDSNRNILKDEYLGNGYYMIQRISHSIAIAS
ncbi:MAG: hypothetical protein WC979_02120 [Candidatus Pacearchaeota archaeon]|jgi:hypothetical protein|nr:hypothetical protein [Clostridia bacterium]